MPGKYEIMRAVQTGLNGLVVAKNKSDKVWTKKVKTELCKIGRDTFGCCVYARDVANSHGGEWLYDVTWLKYKYTGAHQCRQVLAGAPLVAECEWGDIKKIRDDFEKLLLARASTRVMIFDSVRAGSSSRKVAEQLAGLVKDFNGSLAKGAWLFVSWENRNDTSNPNEWWQFKYFTIEEGVLEEGIRKT
jgi:hypothetical protein